MSLKKEYKFTCNKSCSKDNSITKRRGHAFECSACDKFLVCSCVVNKICIQTLAYRKVQLGVQWKTARELKTVRANKKRKNKSLGQSCICVLAFSSPWKVLSLAVYHKTTNFIMMSELWEVTLPAVHNIKGFTRESGCALIKAHLFCTIPSSATDSCCFIYTDLRWWINCWQEVYLKRLVNQV